MESIFYEQGSCNPPIGDWDVSNVTNFVSQSIALLLVVFASWAGWRTVAAVAFHEGLLYCSCILYYNYAHCQHQTKSLTQFLSLSNIATTAIINNNTSPILLLSQSFMFALALAFNQDISSWDVSKGTRFVSIGAVGILVLLLLWPRELGSLWLLLLSLKGCCNVHTFCVIIMLIVNIKLKVSYHSCLCPITSLLLLSSTTIRHHFSCFHRMACFPERQLSTKKFRIGMLAAESIL